MQRSQTRVKCAESGRGRYLQGAILVLAMLIVLPVKASEIAMEDFFRHAEFDNAALSPQGNYLAVSVPEGRNRNLAVLDISQPDNLELIAAYGLRGGQSPYNIRWVSDERFIFSTRMQRGSMDQPVETGRIYAMNADGSNQRMLFGASTGSFVYRQMEVLSYLPDEPDFILIQHWAHDRMRPIAERLNVNRGRTSRVAISPLNRGYMMADQDSQVRFAMGMNDNDKAEFAWRASTADDWQTFANELGNNITPISFDTTGDYVFVSSREDDNLGVYKLELATGGYEAVLGHNVVEVDTGDSLMFSADQRNLLGARFMDGVTQWHTLNDDVFEVQWLRQLEAMFEGYLVNISNWTADGRRAIVNISGDVAPSEYFLLDTEGPELRFLAASRPWIDPNMMQPMQPFSFEARDGLALHGYKTLPAGYEQGQSVPFIVWVHGGPHGPRDRWIFDPYVQMFAANGIGVLQVNFRGSGGYGVDFEESGHREWGGKMQDDVTDATHWLLEQGYTSGDKVCIGGGSYGGYATLSGITQKPDLYACAFAFVGVYDLELMKTTGDIPESEMGRRYLDRVLGTDEDVLKARSPSNFVENIQTPLFIAHGADDIRAHVDHYHLLKARLDDADIAYEEMLVEGEGHGFYEVENNVALFSRVVEFIHQHTVSDE